MAIKIKMEKIMTTNSDTPSMRISYTEKLSRSVAALSTLYLLPVTTQAEILHVTTPLSLSIDDARAFDYQPVDWDVDGNSVADFRLEAFRTISIFSSPAQGFPSGTSGAYIPGWTSSRPFGGLQLNSAAQAGQGLVQRTGGYPQEISDLALGETVGATLNSAFQWGPSVDRQLLTSSSYTGFASSELFMQGHYIGFSFLGAGDQLLYGWAQVDVDELTLSLSINEWAYDDSGKSIDVGQVPVPPSALLMLSGLALGAGGILRGRKLKQKMTEENRAVS